MNDITIKEIIDSLKLIPIKAINITNQSQSNVLFFQLMDNKIHWTLEEFKEVFKACSKRNACMDFGLYFRLHSVSSQHKLNLNWDTYFEILDELPPKKQASYINRYFWFYENSFTENDFTILINKSYYSFLSDKSKATFINAKLKKYLLDTWYIKYFTDNTIKLAFKKTSWSLQYLPNNSEYCVNIAENDIINFYKSNEHLIANRSKQKFLYTALECGYKEVIRFIYKEKKIRYKNKVELLWHVFSDIGVKDKLDLMYFLKSLGIRFTTHDLKKSQEDSQWGYMYDTYYLEYFIAEQEANKLEHKLAIKKEKINKSKL